MKILLIALIRQYDDEVKDDLVNISANGIRCLSSYLKSLGREVAVLFLTKPRQSAETADELEQIAGLIGEFQPDLIGLSLTSFDVIRAKRLTSFIKEWAFPGLIIWGGIHPTLDPAGCLDYADIVCVGEGETAMRRLTEEGALTGFRTSGIAGLWRKEDGNVIEAGAGELIRNIDDLPFPDYGPEGHFIIRHGRLLPMTESLFSQYYPALTGNHIVFSARGCPNNCSYCCNSLTKNLYRHEFLRIRSVDNFIAELKSIKSGSSHVRSFRIMDSDFTVNGIDWIREFGRRYKAEIGLPFNCMLSPATVDAEKLAELADAGLARLQIGLQTGSDRTNFDIYNRKMRADDFLSAIRLLEKHRDKIELTIDVIVDNPYETEADLLETISVLCRVEKPYFLNVFPLTAFPGTELHRRIAADHPASISDENFDRIKFAVSDNFFNRIIFMIPHLDRKHIKYLVSRRKNPLIRLAAFALHRAISDPESAIGRLALLALGLNKRLVGARLRRS